MYVCNNDDDDDDDDDDVKSVLVNPSELNSYVPDHSVLQLILPPWS